MAARLKPGQRNEVPQRDTVPSGRRLVSLAGDDTGDLPNGITHLEFAVLETLQRYRQAEGNPVLTARVLAIEELLCDLDAVLDGKPGPADDDPELRAITEAIARWLPTRRPLYLPEKGNG